ncbi:hypothetical protein J2S74_002207 [Evansella vedderi]|uniref:DNA primase n=1 Tax=Evansella vedderi TaxID=38282 RepID=A0ABT9ZWF8_9BACI|nr:DNA primase [Evansella vedderi]MDQ0254828.1 hypothetical protein [Evansella vedderi]
MKKKLFLSVLSSVFAVGMLTACGDVEEDPINEPGIEEDGDLDNDGFEDEDQDDAVEVEEDEDGFDFDEEDDEEEGF